MYRLLIVEDEKAIAQGIAVSNPWAEWGFEVVGICGNGKEVVEFIRGDKPDVVLSDIRMPQMDGVALMQYLNQNYPEIKIIILSGYNDFEYLQMSIRPNAASGRNCSASREKNCFFFQTYTTRILTTIRCRSTRKTF